MTCTGCPRREAGENLKTLHTGEAVCDYCPDWILECEAVELLRMPLSQRRKRLDAFSDKRVGAAMSALKERLKSLHCASKGKTP